MRNCFLREYPNLHNQKWNDTFPIFLVCVAVLDSININSSIQTEAKGNFSTTFSNMDLYQRNLSLLWQTSTGGFTACLNATREENWGKLGPWLVTTYISSDWLISCLSSIACGGRRNLGYVFRGAHKLLLCLQLFKTENMQNVAKKTHHLNTIMEP